MTLSSNRKHPWSLVRWINIILAVFLLALFVVRGDVLLQRVRYWVTGTVMIDGIKFSLPSNNPFQSHWLFAGSRYTEVTATKLMGSVLHRGDVFVDVGASIGWFTLFAAKLVGGGGRVIAFEPDPESFSELRRNVEINGFRHVMLEQKALSRETGRVKFFLRASPENRGIVSFGDKQPVIEVETLRLDDYLRRNPTRVDFIKIDTEGAEGLILEGMHETIKQNARIKLLIEFDPVMLKAAGTDPQKLLVGLTGRGFDIFCVDERQGKLIHVRKDEIPELARTWQGNLFMQRS